MKDKKVNLRDLQTSYGLGCVYERGKTRAKENTDTSVSV
jgi:hypothetical protein